MQSDPFKKIAFIGFGEAAQAFCRGLAPDCAGKLHAYDIKTDVPTTRASKHADYVSADVIAHDTAADCVNNADIVFSMVTADQAISAAHTTHKFLMPHAHYFDCNSIAPNTKRTIAAIIQAAGGRYVDVALMAPVQPKLHQTPILVSGPHAETALAVMSALDMNATQAGGEKGCDIGTAASIKMIRSIMVKGLEALMAECVLAGRRAGVEDIVLDSLEKSYPKFGWKSRTAYAFDRMIEHGDRRAAEMAEVAQTVTDLGIDNAMSRATVQWQQAIGDLPLDPQNSTHIKGADAILAAITRNTPKPETKP